MVLRIGADKAGRGAFALGAGQRRPDHRRGDVDADGTAAFPELSRGRNGQTAGAAADVQDATIRAGRNGLAQRPLELLEHLIQDVLGLDPGASGGTIPKPHLLDGLLLHSVHDAFPFRLALAASDATYWQFK